MSHGRAIARNAAWLMVATTAQKVIAFVVFTVVARLVGVEITGRFFFAVSVTSVFVILTDLGITPVVIREMAAGEDRGMAALKRALQAKLFLIPVAILATLAYAFFTQAGPREWIPISLACFVMSADAVSLLWYGALRGKRLLRYEAIGMFTGQVLTGIVSILVATVFHAGVNGLVVALICGSFWNVAWSWSRARALGIRLHGVVPWHWKQLFLQALPFALAGLFVKVYSYIDTLLLQQFKGATAVGHYAVAYKVTYAFQFLPLTFVAALYPGMSALHASQDKEGLKKILHGSLRLMMMLSVPITAGLSAFAPRLIPFVYGTAYAESAVSLAVLSWVLIPIFLDFPIGSLLNATHRAKLKTIAMGVTMVINAGVNAVLVPRLGPLGAAWAGVMSFWSLLLIGVWFTRKDIADARWAAGLFARGMVAAAVLWYGIRFGLSGLPLLAALPVSALFVVFVLIGTKLVVKEDATMLLSWVRKKSPTDSATPAV